MLIGSHNSLSYLPPKRWWMKPFHWMARCQRVDYKKQYALGVRVFDLRIWFDKRMRMEVRHGRMAFKADHAVVHEFLSWLDLMGGCAVRLILEEDKYSIMHMSYGDLWDREHEFTQWCYIFKISYRRINFFGGNSKYDWKVLYDFFDSKGISLDDKYSSATSLFKTNKWQWLRYVDDLWPWLYARLHNKENFKKGTDKECLFVDFVDIQ